MSGAGELVQVPASCVRWTVDVRDKPDLDRGPRSSVFRFRGREWRLYYYYNFGNKDHRLVLERLSRGVPAPIAFSVQVECGGRPGIVAEGLSQEGRIDIIADYVSNRQCIWEKPDSAVLRMCPEFRTHQELRFLIKLTGEDALLATDVKTRTTQTEDIASVQIDCLESLSRDFSKMLDQGSDLDMEFLCAGQSTRANGAVVSARSEVIGSMLSSDMVEGRTRVVKIPNMEPDVFQHFLRYLYTGTLPELTEELALDLYEAGDQYSVLGLARRCSQYLLECLTIDNACRVLVVADAHSDGDFKEAVVRFIVDKEVPRVSSCWPEFCAAHPMLALEVLNQCYNAVRR